MHQASLAGMMTLDKRGKEKQTWSTVLRATFLSGVLRGTGSTSAGATFPALVSSPNPRRQLLLRDACLARPRGALRRRSAGRPEPYRDGRLRGQHLGRGKGYFWVLHRRTSRRAPARGFADNLRWASGRLAGRLR